MLERSTTVTRIARVIRMVFAIAFAATVALGAAACTSATNTSSGASAKPAKVRIGTLPTEDSLPLWVAEKQGLFTKAGLQVEIVSFPSAQERDAALTAGAVDGFMGDIIAAGTLRAGGVPVKIVTLMLGATPAEGRFGIAVKPGSKVTSLDQLAGKPVGTSKGTIQEYVLDQLMLQANVPAEQIKKEVVNKVPIRFELLMSGKLEAAALPEPFLSLAEKQGAKVIADDTGDVNLSQTVLIFSEKYLNDAAGAKSVKALLGVWDEAVAAINKDPNSYRALLAEKAKLPPPLDTTYAVNTYPTHQLPQQEQVDEVLGWMSGAGLLPTQVTYADLVWKPAATK
jgi:NitT/TauT family transport system substrate-binding protein